MVKKYTEQHITSSDAQMTQTNNRNHPAQTFTKTVKNSRRIYWEKNTEEENYTYMSSQWELLGFSLDILEKFSKDSIIR